MSWLYKFITPSKIDNFIKYQSGYKYNFGDNYEEYTTEAFIDNILGLEPPSMKAEAGRAFHKLIELSIYRQEIANPSKIDDWQIIIDHHVDIELPLPELREIKIKGSIAGIDISGRVDSIDAISVRDIKTTSKVDLDNYINSYQWQAYLMLANRAVFVYDIFKVNVDEIFKSITILDYEQLKLTAYPGMQQKVEEVVNDYYSTLCMLESRIKARMESI